MWTKCGSNGKSKVERKKARKTTKKKHLLLRPMAKRIKAKARKVTMMIQKIQRRRRLAHAIIVRKRVTLKRTARGETFREDAREVPKKEGCQD